MIESDIKFRIRLQIDNNQCALQRGFSRKSAPANAALILEEAKRESLDMNKQLLIVLLDASENIYIQYQFKVFVQIHHTY